MIDINELWIGDLLRLKKSGRIGKFDGRVGPHKVRIKIEDKSVVTTVKNIELAPEQSAPDPFFLERLKIEKQPLKQFEEVLDLHIEVLNPSLSSGRPERIITYQIDSAREFIIDAINRKTSKIEIIHGKGEGVLKSEIRHLLSLFEEVNFVFDKNDGGSSEIWFK